MYSFRNKTYLEFGVSITTIRKTINGLSLLGLVEKIQGKGTKVISKGIKMDISGSHGMFEDSNHFGFMQIKIIRYENSPDFPNDFKKLFNLNDEENLYVLKKST